MSVYLMEGAVWQSEKIAKIFSLENQLEKMCRAEAAVANAEVEMGLISKRDADKINSMVGIQHVDLNIFKEQMITTGGHAVVSFLSAWRPAFGDDPAKEVIHYGSTTQDMLDTAKILQLREAHEVIMEELLQNRSILIELAKKYKMTPIAARTHHQHALPITFGYKVAIWLAEVQRQIERLNESSRRLFTVCCYGAVGAMNSLDKQGVKLNELMAKDLKLNWIPVSWHTSRDMIAEYLSDLVSITSTFGKIALELYELSRTEVGEVAEPWTYGNMGSSTLPQKRNPWGLEAMVAISKSATYQIGNMYAAMTQFHERDFMAQYQEEFTIPTICHMCEHILHYGIEIIGRLEVFPDKMLKNLELTNGSIMLENVMMLLTKRMSRYEAHHKLYDYAMRAYKEDVPVKSLILQDKEIMSVITPAELDKAFEYTSYLGICPEEVDAAIAMCK